MEGLDQAHPAGDLHRFRLRHILPGAGVVLLTFASYAVERRCSKHPERFGHGAIEGVAGPETANNAAAQCGIHPLVYPLDSANVTTAILLGALMLFGVKPGPMLISSNPRAFLGGCSQHVCR